MKTQLLQDLEESGAGAAPRQAPARAPRPQVWRRPQGPAQPAARPQSGVPPFAPPPSYAPSPAVPKSAAAPSSAPSFPPPRPAAPPPTAPRPPAPAAAASPETPDGAAIPGWLAERLREDAERDARAQWRATWQRRAVAWSLGTLGLALAVAGGSWMVEQNRVDGALVVVAKTSPEVREAPAAVAPLPEPVAAQVVTDVESEPVKPEEAAAPVEPMAIEPVEPAPPVVAAVAPPTAQSRPVRRKAPEARPAPARRTVVARAPAQPSARQRHEETLLQCRAHGYSERQCVRRACEMTRYGFACKG